MCSLETLGTIPTSLLVFVENVLTSLRYIHIYNIIDILFRTSLTLAPKVLNIRQMTLGVCHTALDCLNDRRNRGNAGELRTL